MYSLTIEYLPDNDQEDVKGSYASPIEAIAAFKTQFDNLERFHGASPMLILKRDGKEIHKEFKPVHRELNLMPVFAAVSGAL